MDLFEKKQKITSIQIIKSKIKLMFFGDDASNPRPPSHTESIMLAEENMNKETTDMHYLKGWMKDKWDPNDVSPEIAKLRFFSQVLNKLSPQDALQAVDTVIFLSSASFTKTLEQSEVKIPTIKDLKVDLKKWIAKENVTIQALKIIKHSIDARLNKLQDSINSLSLMALEIDNENISLRNTEKLLLRSKIYLLLGKILSTCSDEQLQLAIKCFIASENSSLNCSRRILCR